MAKFEIYLNGKHIDTVFFLKNMSAEEVKDALCIHDAFPEQIEVIKKKV